ASSSRRWPARSACRGGSRGPAPPTAPRRTPTVVPARAPTPRTTAPIPSATTPRGTKRGKGQPHPFGITDIDLDCLYSCPGKRLTGGKSEPPGPVDGGAPTGRERVYGVEV